MRAIRDVLWGIVGGLVVSIIGVAAGTSNPTALLVEALVGFTVAAIAVEVIPWERFPRLRVQIPVVVVRSAAEKPAPEGWKALNARRVVRYAHNRGLFLIHTWEPSSEPGQKVKVTVRLAQHVTRDGRGGIVSGPLAWGTVEAVEYIFGDMYLANTRVVTRPDNDFATTDTLYAPLNVLARVTFTDGSTPLLLERYLNFDESNPARPSSVDRDRLETELRQTVGDRFGDLPLRESEIGALLHVLREAVTDLDNLPFTGNDDADIKPRSEPRKNTQVWYLPLSTAKAYGDGIIRSDETVETLKELHKRLLAVRREVWNRYHPPVLPKS